MARAIGSAALLLMALVVPDCAIADPFDGRWEVFGRAEGRTYSVAVFDPRRSRILEVGGLDEAGQPTNHCKSASWGNVLAWSELTTSGALPPIWGHSLVYDSARDRVVVFGGVTPAGRSNEIFVLSLAGPPTWVALATVGTPPSQRNFHTAIYDPVRDRMVVFGGNTGTSRRNDTWVLDFAQDPPAWLELAPPLGPISRDSHVAVYDGARRQMIIHGGNATNRVLSDAMALNLDDPITWEFLPPSPVLAGHAAVVDATGDRMLVVAGSSLWSYALGARTWSSLATDGPRPSGSYPGIAFHPARRELATFNGVPWSTWILPVDAPLVWQFFEGQGSTPALKSGSVAAIDSRRHRILCLGPGGPLDLWEFPLGTPHGWGRLTVSGSGPGATGGATTFYDPVGDRMLFYLGGSTPNELWALDLAGTPTWNRLLDSSPPFPVVEAGAAYDAVHGRLMFDGGTALSGRFCSAFFYYHHSYPQAAWLLDLSGTPTWSALPFSGAFEGLATVYDGTRDRFMRFGGHTESNTCGGGHDPLHTTWAARDVLDALDVVNGTASPIAHAAGPLPRTRWSGAFDPVADRAILFGGAAEYPFQSSELWEWSVATNAFRQLHPDGEVPAPRARPAFLYDSATRDIWMFGGPDGFLWRLVSPDVPTPILAYVEDARFEQGGVRVRWILDPSRIAGVRAQRRVSNASWTDFAGTVQSDGSSFELFDQDVVPGDLDCYRLSWASGPDAVGAGETCLRIPGSPAPVLALAAGERSPGGVRLHVDLAASASGRLDLFDARGRLVRTRSLNAGDGRVQEIDLATGRSLAPGLYWARLLTSAAVAKMRIIHLP